MKYAIVALMLAAVPSVACANVLAFDTSRSTMIDADLKGCQRQSYLPWCKGEIPAGDELTVADLQDAYTRATRNFSYLPERGADRLWLSSYKKTGNEWTGDCDDVVFTTLDLLTHQRKSMKNVFRLIVSRAGTETPDHIVAVALIDGQYYVFADAERRDVYPLTDAKWKPLLISAINSKQWFKAFFQ